MIAILGPVFAFASAVTWAFGSVGYSKITRTHSAYALNFSRAMIALPFFLLVTLFMMGGFQEIIHLRSSNLIWLVVSMISSYGMGDILFLYSTRTLGVPGALAIASCYPLWTALVSVFFEGEKLTVLQAVGLGLTIMGVIIVILNGPRRGEQTPASASAKSGMSLGLGILLALGCSFFWAGNSYSLAHVGKDLSVAAGSAIRMILAMFMTFCMSRAFLPKEPFSLPLSVMKNSFWLIFAEAFGGSYFFMYGMMHSPLAIGTALTSLAPVISVPVAWALKLEKASFMRTSGVCLTVLGLCLLVGFGPVL